MTLPLLKPKRLVPGQTVGIAAPASPPDEPETIRFAIETIESLGFCVKPAAHLFHRNGYLAGDDATRAADLNGLFADESVDAIFCLRGGYGSSRLLPLLDYDIIRANPKVLTGYSDITALLLSIHHKTGLVTFLGPIAGQLYTPYTLTEFKKVLFSPQPTTVIAAPPYLPDLSGAILFLEDVSEAIYSIDRMLTQLWLSGNLQKAAGIVFGKFTESPSSSWIQNRLMEDVLSERVRALNIPTVAGLMIGHVDDQATVPLGCLAKLDASAKTLTLLEEPVL